MLRVFVNVPVNVNFDVTSAMSGNPMVAETSTPTAIDDSSVTASDSFYQRLAKFHALVTVLVVLDEVP